MFLRSLHDRAVLEARFRRDPDLHLMELGDLDDLLWPDTSWFTAAPDGPVALLYAVGEIPTLLALGSPAESAAVEDLVRAMLPVLPRRFFGHLSGDASKVLEEAYEVRSRSTLLRMALSDMALVASHPAGPWKPDLLTRTDLPDLLRLFAEACPGNWFDDRMLDTGQYVGVRDGGRLIAVAGVHVWSPVQRVAALGNVTTSPELRGRGAAGACVAALCRQLAKTTDHIGLNVRADNATAIALYRRLGFTEVARFTEAVFTALP
ncbi:GNAT family N-acetyltransferase [Kitasatospora sp. NBC_00240]|uniref:GNAT family N-acetyltransferase n=1 Tax=Kitasatospora sp. NBC_00240 TaxID=2903567 RepID=UPI00224E5B0C|nr:GNAT family N-acetyltransferase [Kitasatospora sp. NBC_00240]MCX5207872.1 GNAT family N-acetyltransferase [Kitasatospora sp. NBC_00240]